MSTERGTVRKLKEIDLLEVSVVGFAMNPLASVTSVKSFVGDDGQIASKREVERAIRDVFGLSQSQAKAFVASGYKGISRDEEELLELSASLDQLLHLAKGAKKQ
jgi:hypothetical protein